MDDLITFLRDCLLDDERVALAAPAGPWHTSGPDTIAQWAIYDAEWSVASATAYDHDEPLGMSRGPGYIDPDATAEHIARWDPARVLAEVDAKRRRLDWIEGELADDTRNVTAQWLAKLEAQPLAGREGWREEWRLDPSSRPTWLRAACRETM